MVDFGGWEMPQQYSSIRDEHLAVRKVAGLFDVSHMGRFRVTGDSAQAFIQSVLSNDVSSLIHGQAQYNLMCNEAGGIIDDLIVGQGGQIEGVVMGVGGVLGVGAKQIGVRLSALKISTADGKITITLPDATKEMLGAIGAYQRATPAKK